MTRRSGRALTAEERALWRTVTRSVRRLKVAPPEPEPDALPEAPAGPAPRAAPPRPVPARPATAKPPVAPLAPLGRRLKQRIARGGEAIDARIDLHGLTQAQAHDALLHFLRREQAKGARLVLVITGKGLPGDDPFAERGVLKRQVPRWLALPEFRACVLGFESSHKAHGGEGALYVRLRRWKPA